MRCDNCTLSPAPACRPYVGNAIVERCRGRFGLARSARACSPADTQTDVSAKSIRMRSVPCADSGMRVGGLRVGGRELPAPPSVILVRQLVPEAHSRCSPPCCINSLILKKRNTCIHNRVEWMGLGPGRRRLSLACGAWVVMGRAVGSPSGLAASLAILQRSATIGELFLSANEKLLRVKSVTHVI